MRQRLSQILFPNFYGDRPVPIGQKRSDDRILLRNVFAYDITCTGTCHVSWRMFEPLGRYQLCTDRIIRRKKYENLSMCDQFFFNKMTIFFKVAPTYSLCR